MSGVASQFAVSIFVALSGMLGALRAPTAWLEAGTRPATTAIYRVTFQSTWSAATHPLDFPGNAHFSGLIGATHTAGVSFWDVAALASGGIESMAETGSKALLASEVNAAIDAGTAEFVLNGGGISISPGQVTMEFEVSAAHPLVTLVSMLAPSPDWFVGVSGLDLRDGGGWAEQIVVPLVMYDAGTDSGTHYTSANDDTDPQKAISELTDTPFDVEQQVGSFTFELLSVVGVETDEWPTGLRGVRAYPNPAAGTVFVEFSAGTGSRYDVRMFDVLGRVVASHSGVAGGRLEIDLGGWPRGLYVVSVSDGVTSSSAPVAVVR